MPEKIDKQKVKEALEKLQLAALERKKKEGEIEIKLTNGLSGAYVPYKNGKLALVLKSQPGPEGDTGVQGEMGEIGPEGILGKTGPQGDRGFTGNKGPKGFQGTIGPEGKKGDKGDFGEKGLPGPIGILGERGDIGPEGPRGFAPAHRWIKDE